MRIATSGINSIKLLAQKQNREKEMHAEEIGLSPSGVFCSFAHWHRKCSVVNFPFPMNVSCCHILFFVHLVAVVVVDKCIYLLLVVCLLAIFILFCFVKNWLYSNTLSLRHVCLTCVTNSMLFVSYVSPSFDPRRSNYYAVDRLLFYVCVYVCFVCLQLCTSFENGGL